MVMETDEVRRGPYIFFLFVRQHSPGKTRSDFFFFFVIVIMKPNSSPPPQFRTAVKSIISTIITAVFKLFGIMQSYFMENFNFFLSHTEIYTYNTSQILHELDGLSYQ